MGLLLIKILDYVKSNITLIVVIYIYIYGTYVLSNVDYIYCYHFLFSASNVWRKDSEGFSIMVYSICVLIFIFFIAYIFIYV